MKVFSKLMLVTAFLFLLLLVVCLVPQAAVRAAATYYVAPGGDNNNDCLSPSTACATIRSAINRACAGDTVQLLPGTYSVDSGESFPVSLSPGVSVIGSGYENTIISGNPNSAVIFIGGLPGDFSSDTVLQDLTIQDGSIGLHIDPDEGHSVSPTIVGSQIRFNEMGIRIDSGEIVEYGTNIGAIISDTQISFNYQTGIYLNALGYLSPTLVRPSIVNCIIEGNGLYGIHAFSSGYGNLDTTAAPLVINTHIIGNASHGVFAQSGYSGWSSPFIEQSWIIGNLGYGTYWEQYPYIGRTNTAITNTVIASNISGGVFIGSEDVTYNEGTFKIVNSNIQNNLNYGINWQRPANIVDTYPQVVNSIVWNPDADDLFSTGDPWSMDEISYSDVEDGDLNGQGGNISLDPNYLDDYHITACSPLIDIGSTDGMPLIDIDGEPRPQGNGTDIGVDEQAMPRLLSTDKQVSSSQAHFGETLAYTLTITPVDLISPTNLTLVDTLPQSLSLLPESLWASTGTISHTGEVVHWSGSLTSTMTARMGFEAEVVAGSTTIQNIAFIDAGLGCSFQTPFASTSVAPVKDYLAMVNRAPLPRGIYGTVTKSTHPIASIPLDLRFYDGDTWSTISTRSTAADGSYSFTGIPALNPGQYYYVRFQNQSNDMWLWTWHTRSIGVYTAGSDYRIGDFDISNIGLGSPSSGEEVSLPRYFHWEKRWGLPTDSYEFNLFDPYDGIPYFYTDPPLGYMESYLLQARPYGFNPFSLYVWEIWVYSPDGGFGISYRANVVYFNNKLTGSLPGDQIPTPKVVPDLEPRKWR